MTKNASHSQGRLSTKGFWLALGLSWLMVLALWNLVVAAAPPEDGPEPPVGRRVGLVSTEVSCLTVQGGVPDTASASVRLQWEGQVEEAFLVLSAASSEAGHSIYVNGHLVGSAPVRPGGLLCRAGSSGKVAGPVDRIPISAKVLEKGENVIVLTNDADTDDGWTAANLHIEIHGVLSGPPVAALEIAVPSSTTQRVGASVIVSGMVALTSSYELEQGSVITQVVWYQIPMSYTGGVSVPLLIGLHGMGGTGEWTRDYLAAEANNRGWLLAAPDMHGHHYVNHGKFALGWIGAQHDIIDTIEYMASEYEVDPSRIYVVGGSMGGQAAALMAAKYPDLFPATIPWKPLTDLGAWYYEIGALGDPYGDQSTIRNEAGGSPLTVPFEYQRRSPIWMPQNSRLMPLEMWHDVDDQYVPIHHSYDLRDAINNHWNPPTPVTLIEVPSAANDCPPDGQGHDFEHCYNPPQADIFDFLSGFALAPTAPISLSIRTDESKTYFWLNMAQTGGDHWSELEASYSLSDATVTVTISDTQPLTLAFNLGSTPTVGPGGVTRSGMGLPTTTYLISGGGNYKLENYTSGYLTTTLNNIDPFTLTISAITVEVSANPSAVPAGQTATSTISAVVRDRLNNPVPDGTIVQFSATEGAFPNANSTFTTTTVGGQAVVTLTVTLATDPAQITASVESVTGTASVVVAHNVYLPAVIKNN